ncbi:tRNA dihydrouridine synthase DusB [Bacteroidetes/Chlorobi group bacterium ChocPot_Mid]|nr:MAG: tRNA dihydrouridine synthase DusB [Bacteroidetes/Chlorobi group bacterium ChocPot_Mid]
MKIGKIDIEHGLVLAPMESITDLPFRLICKRMGAELVYTEFIASEALIRDVERSKRKMNIVDEERPVAVQIFGDKTESMVSSAKMIEDSGADIVDINFGCWVKKVVNNNAGAAFLKCPEKMADMVRAIVDSVSIPVTAKTRLGWDSNSFVIVETAQMLEQAGVLALAVHCRTRAMGMSGAADWSWIPKVKEKVKIPIILNGDVNTPVDAKKAFDTTQCDAVMIARAAIGNPFIFKSMKEYLVTGKLIQISVMQRIETCLEHLKLSMDYKGERKGILEFRKNYSGYLKGLFDSASVRQKLVLSESYDEIRGILMNYYQFLEESDRLT